MQVGYHDCVSPLLGLIISRFFKRAERKKKRKKEIFASCFSKYPFSLLPGQYQNKNKACKKLLCAFRSEKVQHERRGEKISFKKEKAAKGYHPPLELLTASLAIRSLALAACVRSKS